MALVGIWWQAQVTVVVSVHVPPTQFGRFEDFIRAITKSALLIPGEQFNEMGTGLWHRA